jgi:hypothetical protein
VLPSQLIAEPIPLQVDGIDRHAFILPRERLLDSEGNETEVRGRPKGGIEV